MFFLFTDKTYKSMLSNTAFTSMFARCHLDMPSPSTDDQAFTMYVVCGHLVEGLSFRPQLTIDRHGTSL